MADKLKIPGGALANRPLHFFWMVDCSSSMAGDRIGAVNHAIQECIEPMREEAAGNPNAQLYIHTLKFASGASWVTAEPVPIEEFAWEDVEANGITDMGKAFELLAGQLSMPPMPDRALPPVIVLLTDGYPTDDWKRPLEKLLKMPWGKKAVKVAIAIGKDAERVGGFHRQPGGRSGCGQPGSADPFHQVGFHRCQCRFQPHQQSYGGGGCAGDGAVLPGNPGTPYAGRQHHPAGFG